MDLAGSKFWSCKNGNDETFHVESFLCVFKCISHQLNITKLCGIITEQRQGWECFMRSVRPPFCLSLHVPPQNCSYISIPIWRKYCKHFHEIFPTSQTCYNFNRQTSRICFIKILQHFRLFLEEDSALEVLLSGFYEPARKMLDSSENLHSSSRGFSVWE